MLGRESAAPRRATWDKRGACPDRECAIRWPEPKSVWSQGRT